jgi:hypothetical protein
MKRCFLLLLATMALILWSQCSFCQTLYSYLDLDGVQVLTNIAPTCPVLNLKIIGAVPPPPAPPPPIAAPPKTKAEAYDPIIVKYAANYHLDPSLIRSIIEIESGFNAKAVSSKGARGLMQLMPETAKQLGVKDSYDPEQNIQGGVKHFRSLMDTFNQDIGLSLAAYNAGENLVLRLGRIPSIKETQDYVELVTKRYQKLKNQEPLVVQAQVNEKEPEPIPALFRFMDESGVLYLTNIPPMR